MNDRKWTEENLQRDIGYTFLNISLLREAMTHSSFSSERDLSYDNQRLEFLGDAVLDLVVADYLFKTFPNKSEGELTSIRSVIVQKNNLAKMAKSISLSNYLYLGKGEREADGANRESTLCDAFEALIGAMYLDSNLLIVSNFIQIQIKAFVIEIAESHKWNNPKGVLQELVCKRLNSKPVYIVKSVEGPDHAPTFNIDLLINDKKIADGVGANKKQAEIDAANKAIKLLERNEAL